MQLLVLVALVVGCQSYSLMRNLPYEQQKQNKILLNKLDILGNEIERIWDKVGNPLGHEEEEVKTPGAAGGRPTLNILRGRREVGEEYNVFTVEFTTPKECWDISSTWTVKPTDHGVVKRVESRINAVYQEDDSVVCEAIADVEERGELVLTLWEGKRYEVTLQFDNSAETSGQEMFQREVHLHNFAVLTQDAIFYRAGEKLKLPVEAKNAGPDKYQVNIDLDIPYLSKDDEVEMHHCYLRGNEDTVCRTVDETKYLNSFEFSITLDTSKIEPVGVTRVFSVFRDSLALITSVKLTRVLRILSVDQPGYYPEDFIQVKAFNNTCFYNQAKCVAQCVVYGDFIADENISIARLSNDTLEVVKGSHVQRKAEFGQVSLYTEFMIPETKSGMNTEMFTCTFHGHDGHLVENTGYITYKTKTEIVREKSFYEINEHQVKVTCTARGQRGPTVYALLSMTQRRDGKDREYELRYKTRETTTTELGEVTAVFYYEHDFGRFTLESIDPVCFARSGRGRNYEYDRFPLVDMTYLHEETHIVPEAHIVPEIVPETRIVPETHIAPETHIVPETHIEAETHFKPGETPLMP